MGSRPCHPPQTAEGTSQAHTLTLTHTEPSCKNPLQGTIKCRCSTDVTQHKQGKTQISQSKQNNTVCAAKPRSIPSRGTLEFLVLSLSSDVSLLTAVPLLVLRNTLNARFSLLKERLLTEERSKFLTAKESGEKERHL